MQEVPRGDFPRLPPWYAEAVARLCWSDAAFTLAPPDDFRFGLFADDLQNAAVLLCRALYPPWQAWPVLCRRLPVAARLAWDVPPRAAVSYPEVQPATARRAAPPAFWVEAGQPRCQHGVVRRVPAGVSRRTGKPYREFWSCPARVCRIPDAAFEVRLPAAVPPGGQRG
jgi:hypothetical protein